NLVGNALKFTDSGGRITIRGKAVEEGVEFRVVDTGLGIPADQLERIFDRFAQVDGSATRKHEGTGIGLSLTHELVALHGGRIWAESQGVGCGSSICVVLPVGEADGQAGDEEVLETDDGRRTSLRSAMEAAEAELHLGDGDPGEGATLEMERTIERWEGVHASGAFQVAAPAHLATAPEILVAEDNPDMRKLLAFLLSREFRVRVARNGREALDSLREQAPTLVLTDVMMPEMSGTELCRAIKGDPETAGIPVVLVTSKAEREMKIEGLELGADDYVTKPFHPRELLARVRSLVRVRQLQEELAEQNASLDRALAELKRAEVQLVQNERLAAVGELAAGIAHEVNNPVNFALNAVRTLQSKVGEVAGLAGQMAQLDWRDRERLAAQVEALREAQEELGFGEVVKDLGELVEIVSEGLARTSRLVADLRDFAAPGQRKYAPVDFQKSIESTAQLLRHRLSESNARVEVRIPENLPEFQGDGPALNQVFLNLLKNAAEALDGTGGSIWVDASVVDGGIEIVFRDDGPGIEPAVRERLFEPFFTTKSAGRGTGLGLSISRQIAEAHGGRLEVESAEGEGSTFTLRLPV
ncbi:MAG: ATP-binding protein, partial [Proteobacteria bacterium]|nr:ATP-binding protein [Pseudomonadota bacterium]